jgi:hypothetical protein
MNEHEERDKRLDEMLDAALAEYGAVEPLDGLEERVLDRLRAREARRPWWIWGAVATAVAAVTIAAVLLGRPAEEKRAPVAEQPPPAVSAPKQQPAQQAPRVVATTHAPKLPVAQAAVAQPLPKRDVFPTPGPPTSEERLLARYMRVTPREIVMAEVNRQPLELPRDPLSSPNTDTNPSKNDPLK